MFSYLPHYFNNLRTYQKLILNKSLSISMSSTNNNILSKILLKFLPESTLDIVSLTKLHKIQIKHLKLKQKL